MLLVLHSGGLGVTCVTASAKSVIVTSCVMRDRNALLVSTWPARYSYKLATG